MKGYLNGFQEINLNDPSVFYGMISCHFYKLQIVGDRSLIRDYFSGGFIHGICSIEGEMRWFPSTTFTAITNISGPTGIPDYRWLRVIYKVVYSRNYAFSSSLITQDNELIKRNTYCQNFLSILPNPTYDEMNLILNSFNSEMSNIIVFSNGLLSDTYETSGFAGKINLFDENISNPSTIKIGLIQENILKVLQGRKLVVNS